jgi:hypothetical protein
MSSTAAAPGAAPSELDRHVKALIKAVSVTMDDVQFQKACVKELMGLATEVGPDWIVRPFGSTVNGFRTRHSDLDVSCYRDMTGTENLSADEQKERRDLAIQTVREKLVPLLYQNQNFEVVEEIWMARIPILRLRYQNSLEVDMSFCNTEPFANTQLLRAYSKLNIKVRNLVMLVKLWADGEKVCGPKEGHLSSYALTLMTLYFLQVDEYIKMPCLPTVAFDGSADHSQAQSVQWSCELSVEVMLYRFFSFFAMYFIWGKEVISIRLGKRNLIEDSRFSELPGHFSKKPRLHIEDPFLLGRNLNCVLKEPQEHVLWQKICEALAVTQHAMVPPGLKCCKASQLVLEKLSTEAEERGKSAITKTTDAHGVPEVDYSLNAAANHGYPLQMKVRQSALPTPASQHENGAVKRMMDTSTNPTLPSFKDVPQIVAMRPIEMAPAPEDVPLTSLWQTTESSWLTVSL